MPPISSASVRLATTATDTVAPSTIATPCSAPGRAAGIARRDPTTTTSARRPAVQPPDPTAHETPRLVLSAAEERQHQKEHVEDVEEDRGREQRGAPDVQPARKARPPT